MLLSSLMSATLIVLAAGIGSRYGGLKQVDSFGPKGETILEFSLYEAQQAGFDKAVIVLRKDIEEEFRRRIGSRLERVMAIEYAFQEIDTALDWLSEVPVRTKPWGTGHAILAARSCVREPFATINADDLYGADAFQIMAYFLERECAPNLYGMVAYRLSNTLSENGAVARGVCTVGADGYLADVVERTRIERYGDSIGFIDEVGQRHFLPANTPVSMNLWGFYPTIFEHLEEQFKQFIQQHLHDPKAEFYIPSVVSQLLREGRVRVRVEMCESEWYGVTYPADKVTVQRAIARLYPQGLPS
ncbi:MAG: nucleotidyltransferase [Saprospiraceae bacterium]|nr:nucleotidyltransferase [Saprospiraceae bacterium]MDW8484379.1 nucleotidyltransferase [Saprospiraceae bacterium]